MNSREKWIEGQKEAAGTAYEALLNVEHTIDVVNKFIAAEKGSLSGRRLEDHLRRLEKRRSDLKDRLKMYQEVLKNER